MNQKKTYTAISVILAMIMIYELGTFIYGFIKSPSYLKLAGSVGILPSLLGITSIIIFYTSNFKQSTLLRFFMCIVVFSFPFTAWLYIKYYFMQGDFGFRAAEYKTKLLINIFVTLVNIACSATGLWLLSKDQTVKLTYIENGDEKVGQFDPATTGLRIANHLIDTVIIAFFILAFFASGSLIEKGWLIRDYWGLYLLDVIIAIVYYLMLEGIFNTTAGKCLTNTIVVDATGNRPGFSRMLGRTFCRIIPFDALSFLGNSTRGWHDSMSDTYVSASVHKDDAALNEITLDAEQNLIQE